MSLVAEIYDTLQTGVILISQDGDEIHRSIYDAAHNVFDELMLWNSLNEFSMDAVRVNVNPQLLAEFQTALGNQPPNRKNVRLLFHGTLHEHTRSILDTGFDDARVGGATDEGWYGFGHYFTPNVEYAVAYTQNKKGNIRRLQFHDAIDRGTSVDSLIACIVIIGNTRELGHRDLQGLEGSRIHHSHDSHEAFVDKDGSLCDKQDAHASELIVPFGNRVLPLFQLSVTRAARCIIWQEANPNTADNIRLAREIRCSGTRVLIINGSGKAGRIFSRLKGSVEYTVVTAGAGGEDFVRYLRGRSDKRVSELPVLVFCAEVKTHRAWAGNYSDVEVTGKEERFLKFCKDGRLELKSGGGCVLM